MKLRNKQTGEILTVERISSVAPTLVADKKTIQLTGTDTETGYRKMYRYKSLAEISEEWEDAPDEPKKYWWISDRLTIYESEVRDYTIWHINICKEIGNYFETKEEAEKAVEKLKAWKRLKDKYDFKFTGWKRDEQHRGDFIITAQDWNTSDDKLLDLLFGGEE